LSHASYGFEHERLKRGDEGDAREEEGSSQEEEGGQEEEVGRQPAGGWG
jgi:hypothetical protein